MFYSEKGGKNKKEKMEQHRHKTTALSYESVFKILPDISLPPPQVTTEIDVPFIKAQQAWKKKASASQNKSLLKKHL